MAASSSMVQMTTTKPDSDLDLNPLASVGPIKNLTVAIMPIATTMLTTTTTAMPRFMDSHGVPIGLLDV
jgi:hypothetical protein